MCLRTQLSSESVQELDHAHHFTAEQQLLFTGPKRGTMQPELSPRGQRVLRQIRALRALPETEVGFRAEQRLVNSLNITDTILVADALQQDDETANA